MRWSWLLVLTLLVGCEPDPRNDAVLFLDRVQRIDLDDPLDDRRRMVQSLASLPISAEAVGEARDICVEAHQSLITAEDASARARSAFESYESESAIPAVERQRIEADVARSDRALSASSQLFSRCHRLTRDLELRYRSRRRRQ